MTELLSSASIGPIKLKNRVIMAPLTRGRAGDNRVPNELMKTYYTQRASAGMVISEATVVSKEGNGWDQSAGIYTDEMAEGWKHITDAMLKLDCPMVLQLWHCGRASHSDFHDGELPLSASAIKLQGDGIHTPKGKKEYETPRAMTQEDIQRTVADYQSAATRAKAAGFAGVEIHGANGYLINQFTDSRSNQRTDEYGGTIANRCRLLEEVTQAVLEVWPADRVGVRISPNGSFNDMGAEDFRETHLYIASMLNRYKLGYLHIMDGLGFGFHELGKPMVLTEFRALFRQAIIGNVGYTQETAQDAVITGDADMIAFGRPFITNPDLPLRFANGQPLTPWNDMSTWYTHEATGYTDYKALNQA